ERTNLIDTATMSAVERLDETLRGHALERGRELEQQLASDLVRAFAVELVGRWRGASLLAREPSQTELDSLPNDFRLIYGMRFAQGPAQEDVNHLAGRVVERFESQGVVKAAPRLLEIERGTLGDLWASVAETLGRERPTFLGELLTFVQTK